MSRPLQLSDAEWRVMKVLWDLTPASARDVLEVVGEETGWAYTTVKTMLARLVDKGALHERKRGNVSLYEPLLPRTEARHSAVRGLLDRAFDGTLGGLLHHLAEEEPLSRKERDQLRAWLEEQPSRRRSSRS